MKQRKPTGRDGLQQWIERTLVRAVGLTADEIRYERGKDGLTVEFRKGARVLDSIGPYQRYKERAIPRLQRMGQQGLPSRLKGETGRFLTVWDGREWNSPVFYTKSGSGERLAVRFTSSKQYTG